MKRLSFVGAIALAVGVTLAVAPTVGANAHDYLTSSTPGDGTVVTDPLTAVSLTFSDVIIDLTGVGTQNVVYVTGPNGSATHFETGCATVLGRVITAPVALGAAGTYSVAWRVVSSDGHPVTNSLTFDYQPSAAAADTVSAGSETSPCTASTNAGAGPGDATVNVAPQSEDSSNSSAQPLADIWWLVIGFGGIVLLALLVWWVVTVIRRK